MSLHIASSGRREGGGGGALHPLGTTLARFLGPSDYSNMKWPSLLSGRDFVALDNFDDLSQRELVGPLSQTRRF